MDAAIEKKQLDIELRRDLVDAQSIDDYPFTEAQKELAIMYAVKLIARAIPELDWGGYKSYDPLLLSHSCGGERVAHSYVMDLEDGGRHHDYRDLNHLEQMIVDEIRREVREAFAPDVE